MNTQAAHIVTGHVKWFDPTKGYGFVRPSNGGKDILLHVTALRNAGLEVAYEGARIVCEIALKDKGLQAVEVIEIDDRPPAPKKPQHHIVATASDWERVTVRWFNRPKGFGFLTRGEGTHDIFVHAETVQAYGFVELRPGQALLIRFGHGEKGLLATELRPCGPA